VRRINQIGETRDAQQNDQVGQCEGRLSGDPGLASGEHVENWAAGTSRTAFSTSTTITVSDRQERVQLTAASYVEKRSLRLTDNGSVIKALLLEQT